MFISVNNLHKNMGVDEIIARFFVDRKVPGENVFWKNRLVYVSFGNGYISIPVYYDLLFRIGIPRELLLEETHVQFMEAVMHYAIQVEFKEISFGVQLEKIRELMKGRIKNQVFYKALNTYLDQEVLKPLGELGMPVSSLMRADVFLYILCDLPMTAAQISAAIKYWYALHSTYLLLDDVYDYEIDKQDEEENAVMELGGGQTGYDRAFELMHENVKILRAINPLLSESFIRSMENLPDFTP